MRELIFLCTAYAISLFYRGMLSVIATEISTDLGLNEIQLGLLASGFFFSFAFAQIPTGIVLDRIGGRLTIVGSLWFAVFGIGLFSIAQDFQLAMIGQVLIGIGCAPVFTGAMLIIGQHFPPERFAFITALVIAIGSLGDLMGTTPLAIMTQWLGWRASLQLVMLMTVLTSVLCLIGLSRDKALSTNESWRRMLSGMVRICAIRNLWSLMPMFLTSYAILMAVRGVWGGPYLADAFSADSSTRGFILMAMSLAMAAGTFLLGMLDQRYRQTKLIVAITSILAALPLILLAAYPGEGPYFAMFAFVILGLLGFNYPLIMSHSRTFLTPEYYGRGMAVLTAVSFLGIAIIQSFSGWLLTATKAANYSPYEQYQILFLSFASLLIVATIIYCFSDKGLVKTGSTDTS